jgi:restriction system protein
MPTRYRWQKVISNGYSTKIIRAMTKAEFEQKAAAQQAVWRQQQAQRQTKWQAQIARQAAQDQLSALELQASAEAEDAQARIHALETLLLNGLHAGNRLRWDQVKEHRQFPPYEFREMPPTYEDIAQRLHVPAPSALEGLLSGKRKRRAELEAQAYAQLGKERANFEARKAAAYQDYQQRRATWERGRDEYNAFIDTRQQEFERGDPDAVKWVLERVLINLSLPESFGKDYDLAFDADSGTAVVNMPLPTIDEMPRVITYKFVKTRKAIDPVEMKQKEFEAFYDSVLHQITLLTIYRIFLEATSPALQSAVFNGWVTGVDRKTGHDFTSCVISVQAPRATFESFNLERVDPKECVRSLKGLVAGPLAQLAPVKPIMDLNKEDSRFIESREVLANLSSIDNLASMDWEDFEHLVRELFSKIFGGEGTEVRVTQASRDRGVDAIAFDPDPIRGGKFVIQAKHYNIVVPVSAVRDLYGTMINEGAAKGFLVTTSHYGNDSREFAKDKPITLIDGANLVHLFQQYGYDVRIDIKR